MDTYKGSFALLPLHKYDKFYMYVTAGRKFSGRIRPDKDQE